MSTTYKALAALLGYPTPELVAALPEIRAVVDHGRKLEARTRTALRTLVDELSSSDLLDAQERYVALFDRGRATSLHLFEHVHGDSRERGPAMVDLAKTYEAAGLYLAPGEMPDYLPAFLEFASTQPPREARASLAEIAHILNRIMSALVERNSAYASVIGALLDLAGEKAQAVKLAPEEPLDATWEEPPAFAGCSSRGQARPDAPQTIQFVRPS